ncbi:MAG: prepilin-type N-terminal cleavage/methylation domain-containing protein [bacterium]|nr:prepilin-type N-terminal cleavage/methylation domain-containing protein [bacterium]
MIRNIRKDNQGFTLVELLVSIAIAAIVAVSIAAFMIVGSRSYASTSSEVNLQYEAQLAFNQLQDLIIDTTLGVNYSYIAAGDGINGTETEVLRDSEIPSDAAFKKIYMYNDTVVYIVIWDRAHSWLYYEEYAMNADRSIGAELVNEARMADYITAFGADLSRLEEKRIVRVNMGFAKNTKTYESAHNITIRNKVAVNGDPASYTPVTPSGIADSIVVNSPVYLEPGDTYTFPAPVVNSKTAVPASQEVRWYIDDTVGGAANPHHANTMIDVNAGRLQISPYETNESFKVTVRARDGSGVSNTITVNLVRVNTVTLQYTSTSTPPVTQDKLTNDNTFTLTAAVDGYHLNDAGITTTTAGKSIADIKKLTWAITDGADYFTGAESSNLVYQCKMNAVAIVKDKTMTVRATNTRSMTYGSGGDSVVYGEWSGKTFQKDPDFVIVGSGSYARGAQHAFNIQKRLGDDWSTHIYLYDVTLKEKVLDAEGNVTGYTNIKEHWTEGIAMSGGETNIQITLPVDLDPYKGYVVDIICYAFVKHRAGDPSGYYLPYSDYDIKDAIGVSNSISLDIGTSELYFSKSGDDLVLTKYYIPRTYGQRPNDTSETMVYCGGITNMSGNLQFSGSEFSTGDGNRYRGWVTWKLYTDVAGRTLFTPPAASSSIFSHEDERQQFKIYFRRGKWYEELPARLYLIPTLTIENKTKGETNTYLMNHTHIEYINHNITVTKDGKNYHLYFPYPTADDFPGKRLAEGGLLEGDWYNSFDFSSTMKYTIKRYQDSSDVTQYTLRLQNGATVYGNYTIPVDGMNWVKN